MFSSKILIRAKQARRVWFTRFALCYIYHWFLSKFDSSLFIFCSPTTIIYIFLYVDDIGLTPYLPNLFTISSTLSSEFFMTDLGPLSYFLGTSISSSTGNLCLSQRKYALEHIRHSSMSDCTPATIPIELGSKISITDGDPLDNPSDYQSLICALLYPILTRFDITYAIRQTCLFMCALCTGKLSLLKWILRYVKGTLNFIPLISLIEHLYYRLFGC